jgi:glycosyltransferase involved in cell wall biosynthesis
MLVTRQALLTLGYLDQEMFGKGYGEENDFCMRAMKRGFRNIMALDVFVRHTGETSFGIEAGSAQARGVETVQKLHPNYLTLVHDYLRKDPARSVRQKLDAARLKQSIGSESAILCLTHNRGGGIARYLKDKTRVLRGEDIGLLTLAPVTDAAARDTLIELNCVKQLCVPNLRFPFLDLSLRGELAQAIRHFTIRSIEVHSLVGWPSESLDRVPQLAQCLDASYDVVLHDYVAVCPQINLINESGVYCGEKGIEQCRSCLSVENKVPAEVHGENAFVRSDKTDREKIDVIEWRRAYYGLLKGSNRILAPSADTAQRFRRYFPDLNVQIFPHEEDLASAVERRHSNHGNQGEVRVALIGALGPHKGSRVLRAIALDALARNLAIWFRVIGWTDIDEQLKNLPNVNVTGPYREEDVFSLIRDQACDIALLPSVWPETYSYTFSIARAAGLPTVVFDLGAPAERAANDPGVSVVPLALASQPSELNDLLISFATRFAIVSRPELSTVDAGPITK